MTAMSAVRRGGIGLARTRGILLAGVEREGKSFAIAARGNVGLSFGAKRLRMSRRSLPRALAEHGPSFSEIRDDK